MYIYIYIQSVSQFVDITAGDDFLGLCDQKSSYKYVLFWTVTELWAFFNSHTRPRVNRVLRNQLARDVLNLLAYRLRCKHYFCRLTRPLSNRESSFLISTLGSYWRIAGWWGGWVFVCPVYTAWLIYYYLFKNHYHVHYSDCAGSWCSEQYSDSFIKTWRLEATG